MGSPRHGHRQNDGRAAFHGHRHNDGHAARAVGHEQTIAQLKLEAVELKRKGKYGAALVKLYEAKAREAKDEHVVRALTPRKEQATPPASPEPPSPPAATALAPPAEAVEAPPAAAAEAIEPPSDEDAAEIFIPPDIKEPLEPVAYDETASVPARPRDATDDAPEVWSQDALRRVDITGEGPVRQSFSEAALGCIVGNAPDGCGCEADVAENSQPNFL